MNIKTNYESVLKLVKIEITDSIFRKKDVSLDDLELGIQLEHNINKLDDVTYEILLFTTITDDDEKLYVHVKSRAIFEVEQADKDVIEKNTLAIMFPYVRSYISIITTQPGIVPIVLPAMNIAAMLEDRNS